MFGSFRVDLYTVYVLSFRVYEEMASPGGLNEGFARYS